jgi:hypothetical protein
MMISEEHFRNGEIEAEDLDWATARLILDKILAMGE